MVLLFYTTYFSVDLAHHETLHDKNGKGGINRIFTTALQSLEITTKFNARIWE